jgi:hypothetical protein
VILGVDFFRTEDIIVTWTLYENCWAITSPSTHAIAQAIYNPSLYVTSRIYILASLHSITTEFQAAFTLPLMPSMREATEELFLGRKQRAIMVVRAA